MLRVILAHVGHALVVDEVRVIMCAGRHADLFCIDLMLMYRGRAPFASRAPRRPPRRAQPLEPKLAAQPPRSPPQLPPDRKSVDDGPTIDQIVSTGRDDE